MSLERVWEMTLATLFVLQSLNANLPFTIRGYIVTPEWLSRTQEKRTNSYPVRSSSACVRATGNAGVAQIAEPTGANAKQSQEPRDRPRRRAISAVSSASSRPGARDFRGPVREIQRESARPTAITRVWHHCWIGSRCPMKTSSCCFLRFKRSTSRPSPFSIVLLSFAAKHSD